MFKRKQGDAHGKCVCSSPEYLVPTASCRILPACWVTEKIFQAATDEKQDEGGTAEGIDETASILPREEVQAGRGLRLGLAERGARKLSLHLE